MRDDSLEHLASRPAKVGDKLVTTNSADRLRAPSAQSASPRSPFVFSLGQSLHLSARSKPHRDFRLRPRKLGAKLARFRRVNEACRTMHHDALELPSGQVVLLTSLCEAQHATVI